MPTPEVTEDKKPLLGGNIVLYFFGALVTAISVMYFDAKADKEFLRVQLKDSKEETKAQSERADRNEKGWLGCEGGRAERAEVTAEWLREKQTQEK